MKSVITKLILDALDEEKANFSAKEIEPLIGTPPSPDMGDFAFPCFCFIKK